jgi:hypothetical protein
MAEWISPKYADLVAEMKKTRRQAEEDREADQTPKRYFLIPESD